MKDKTLAAIIAGSYTCGIVVGGLPTYDYYSKRESHFQQEIMALENQIFIYKAYLFGRDHSTNNASGMHGYDEAVVYGNWKTTTNHSSNLTVYSFGPGGFGNGNDKTGNPKKPAPPKNIGATAWTNSDIWITNDWTNRLPIIIRGGSGIMQE